MEGRRVLPRLPLGGDDDLRRGVPGRTGGGGKHLGAGVIRVALRTGRVTKRAQGPVAEDGSKPGSRIAVWTALVIILWFEGRDGF